LPLNRAVFERAAILKRKAELRSDETILTLIRMQRIAEDACDTYRASNAGPCQARVHVHAARLKDDLEECMSLIPEGSRSKGL
jgi:hypothetical protein